MKKRIFAGTLLTAAAALLMTVNVNTEAASKKLYIDGSRTAFVGRTIELDADGSYDDDIIKDSRIIWKSSKPSVAKVLRKKGDDTVIKTRKAGTAKITVRIKGTKLKASMKLKVKSTAKASAKKNTAKGSNSDQKKLAKYRKQIKQIHQKIKNTNWNVSAAQRRSLYYSFDRQLEKLDDKLDRLSDRWDDRWGRVAERMDDAIDDVEEYLDDVEDYLEDRYEGDDDDDDDDRDDDRDDDDDDDDRKGGHGDRDDDDDDDRDDRDDDDDDDDDDD